MTNPIDPQSSPPVPPAADPNTPAQTPPAERVDPPVVQTSPPATSPAAGRLSSSTGGRPVVGDFVRVRPDATSPAYDGQVIEVIDEARNPDNADEIWRPAGYRVAPTPPTVFVTDEQIDTQEAR